MGDTKLKKLSKNQRILVYSAPVLNISMIILFPILTSVLGKTLGYILGFCIYWFAFCMPVTLYVIKGTNGLKDLYNQESNITMKMKKLLYAIAFVPCIATFFVVFKGTVQVAGFRVLSIAIAFAAINGTVEEMFWRGVYNKEFSNDILWAYFYPSIFFGAWHIALYYAQGMVYHGGFAPLVFGALFMGLLWGWVAYKTKSIRIVTIAHVITNIFAFTGMIYDNWFI